MQSDYFERVYAGWLGKAIGVRYGAPIENWTSERIQKLYGPLNGYVEPYHPNFAADDDTNGPMFFLRAIEDYGLDATTHQMGLTWLNYAPYEHGFYWWGGYGTSTEHTAYLNLRAGIEAPRSGSAAQNGATMAEQIGGQIFSDAWGLIAPGRPDLAADYAGRMASVSHDGEGINGGRFIAACIAAAFVQGDIFEVIRAGLATIPESSAYHRVVLAVWAEYEEHPDDWQATLRFVQANYGYDKYPGVCHIIPNAAVIALALLHGGHSFDDALNICNMCGWDTDCNVANVGCIMGVLLGLDAIDYQRWRAPINDFLAASGVLGSLNIAELPGCAAAIARLGYRLAGEAPPDAIAGILEGVAPRFHFELPGSTHAFRACGEYGGAIQHHLSNSDERAATGRRSLKLVVNGFPTLAREGVRLYYQTYYDSKDFADSRYDPAFSPVCYPGQTLTAQVCCDAKATPGVWARLYALDANSGTLLEGEAVPLGEAFTPLRFTLPHLEGACIREAGVLLRADHQASTGPFCAWLDDFDISGPPDYALDFEKEHMDAWNALHIEVSQFTRLKGIWQLEGDALRGNCADFAEAYTGDAAFEDYSVTATLRPSLGGWHGLNIRVQGAVRSYAAVLAQGGKLVLMKNENGYRPLCAVDYPWEPGGSYTLTLAAAGNRLVVADANGTLLRHTDNDHPYLRGAVGFSLREGSVCAFSRLVVNGHAPLPD